MKHRGVFALALLALGLLTAAASPVPPSRLITRNSAGAVRLGMTVAQVREALPQSELSRTVEGDGIAMIEVRQGAAVEMVLYAGEADPESPIEEQARVEVISVLGSRYHTAEGVHPGMRLRDVEKIYGKLVTLTLSEIESHEYAVLARQPAGLSFKIELPKIGLAGKYPPGQSETRVYARSAVVGRIEVDGRSDAGAQD